MIAHGNTCIGIFLPGMCVYNFLTFCSRQKSRHPKTAAFIYDNETYLPTVNFFFSYILKHAKVYPKPFKNACMRIYGCPNLH